MDTGILLVYVCGVYALGFAIFHIYFWKFFHGNKDLQNLSPANRGIALFALPLFI